MPRRWFVPIFALVAVGCSQPASPVTTASLQPGDVLRPELSFAPEVPWAVGAEVTIGMLVRGVRATGEEYHLYDADVDLDKTVLGGRVTFFDGEAAIGEPHELPFVHDC